MLSKMFRVSSMLNEFLYISQGASLAKGKETMELQSKRSKDTHGDFNRTSLNVIECPRCSWHFARGIPCNISWISSNMNAVRWSPIQISMELIAFLMISLNFCTFCKGYPLQNVRKSLNIYEIHSISLRCLRKHIDFLCISWRILQGVFVYV